jgi:hypothetical protein
MRLRLKQFSWSTGLLAGAAGLLLLFLFNPARVPIFPVCGFHQLTGLNCPGCGSLRAMHQLLHGNLVEALQYNALLVLSLPLFGWIGFRLARQHFGGGPTLEFRRLWLWLYLGVWIVFGILRILPVPVFAALSP